MVVVVVVVVVVAMPAAAAAAGTAAGDAIANGRRCGSVLWCFLAFCFTTRASMA